MFRITILLLSMLWSSSIFASDYINKFSAHSMMKLKQAENVSKNSEALLKAEQLGYPFSIKNDIIYVDVLVQVTSDEAIAGLNKYGGKVLAKSGDIRAIKIPIDNLNEFAAANTVKSIQISQKRSLFMDKSKIAIDGEEVMANSEITPSGVLGGEGVIVGVFDTGIDVHHPDFTNENGSRILKLWDMSDESNDKSPEGYDYGREYSKAEIDNQIQNVLEKDIHGHGTHVAGTAAGNGNGSSSLRGIAYNSNLIIVKGYRNDDDDTFYDPDIIAGCEYIFKEAEKLGRPAVINLSLGSVIGPHDGKSLLALALTSMVDKGKIIVASAGNSGEMPIHAGGRVYEGQTVEFPIFPQNICEIFDNFCPDIPNLFLTAADIWYTNSTIDEISLVAYLPTESGIEIVSTMELDLEQSFENYPVLDEQNNPLGVVSFMSNPFVPTNGDGNIMIQIHNAGNLDIPIDEFIWSIVIKSKALGTVDMWAGIPIPEMFPFMPLIGEKHFGGNTFMTHGQPGDGDSIISVGSYVTKNSWTDRNDVDRSFDWEIGNYSSFTSLGPARDGRILPAISAPGQIIFASKSKDVNNTSQTNTLEGGLYWGMSGTSMASPHVAGAVALMLQVNPELQFSDVMDVLENSAVRDEFTGPVRNNVYGFGKLNVQNAIDYLLNKTGVEFITINDVRVYPNPTSNYIILELNESIDNPILNLYSTNGAKIEGNWNYQLSSSSDFSSLQLDVQSLTNGVYSLECISGNKVAKFRFVVSKN